METDTIASTEQTVDLTPANSSDLLSQLLESPEAETAETNAYAAALVNSYFKRVELPLFDGPFDLLLHLIKREQLDIYEISITHICKEYLKYLNLMKEYDVNVASEFVVMASKLLYIKSFSLLPKEEDLLDEEEDPKKRLIQQLVEYDQFKKIALDMNEWDWMGRDIFHRPPPNTQKIVPKHSPESAPVEPIAAYHLLVALKTAQDRTKKRSITIHSEAISLKEKAEEMAFQLKQKNIISFEELFPPDSTRTEIITSFLAMLELTRLHYIEILQAQNFAPIQIRGVKSLEDLDTGLLDHF